MQINVTCRHMETTDALRDYAYGRAESGLSEFDWVTSVHVILDVQKRAAKAELVVRGKNHVDIEADSETEDMYASIDSAVDKAVKQVRKVHDKMVDHKHQESIGELEKQQLEAESASDDFMGDDE